ncbi:DNA ligase [Paraburkholderia panacisoli]|uniref:DNA ligase n=2 Tax=Paraburkholderia panacisoli TaxID=2603818 RepID=A0A5B0HD31_9BURK|nr:DNA ligase [Paraburkholderia panacisoli]
MLATLRSRPFSDPDWLFEWKYDGYRCLVRKTGDHVELISRIGNPLNVSFTDIVQAVAAVPGDFVWDTELAIGSGRGSEFGLLQQRAKTISPRNVPAAVRRCPARLYVFDMLANRRDLRGLPLIERKRILRDSFDDTDALSFVSGIIGDGVAVFGLVQTHGFEGMVAKRLASPYVRGRSRDWLKIKWAGYSRKEKE